MLGVVGAARHPADLLSQSLQGVHLGSQMRWKVTRGRDNEVLSKQTKDLKYNVDRKRLPVWSRRSKKEDMRNVKCQNNESGGRIAAQMRRNMVPCSLGTRTFDLNRRPGESTHAFC